MDTYSLWKHFAKSSRLHAGLPHFPNIADLWESVLAMVSYKDTIVHVRFHSHTSSIYRKEKAEKFEARTSHIEQFPISSELIMTPCREIYLSTK